MKNTTNPYSMQKTLAAPCTFEGVALHSGVRVRMACLAAPANHGIVFRRVDLPGGPEIPALWDRVVGTELATTVGHRDLADARVATIEHLMAALYALGITNVSVEIDGPEVPILDGSAKEFVSAFLDAGLLPQPYTTRRLKILRQVGIYENGSVAEVLPRPALRLTVSIDFAHPSIGLQAYATDVTPEKFAHEISGARTFGFLRDLDKLRAHKLAQGASLENVLAFNEEGILNEGGLRMEAECARHKLLDALGDLALWGAYIEGELVSFRAGHAIHARLLRELSVHPEHWALYEAESLAPSASREVRRSTRTSFL